MQTKHAMIDIETLSTHSSRALVLSIAVTPFDLWLDGPRIERSLLLIMPIIPQLLDGRIVDEGTLDFWRKQTPEARLHFEEPNFQHEQATIVRPTSLASAARYLNGFSWNPDVQVWANGIVFDIGNIENIFGMGPHGVPWKYNATRDYRTLIRVQPQNRVLDGFDPSASVGVAHDPVDDNHYQIKRLWTHAPQFMLEDKKWDSQ